MASLLASVALCAFLAQGGQPAPSVDDAVSLQRIRAGLHAPTLTIPATQEPLRYRVVIEGRRLRLVIPWDSSKDTAVPSYVRPSYLEPHYEFLRMVTPEEYRAGVLYPGADVLGPAAGLVKTLKQSARNRQIAAIRRQIADELRQIEEAKGSPQ
jgi:hypothetical protein